MPVIDYTDRRRMRLDVEFYFAAAHRLPRYEGPCFRLHGHNYKFFIGLEGEVDPATGMIIDFDDLSKAVNERVIKKLDHHFLNDLIPLSTAENISVWIWEQLAPHLPGLCQIELFETTDNCVVYRGQ